MGGIISAETNIKENSHLLKFSGDTSVSDSDPFWNSLLSFNLKIEDCDSEEAKSFDESVAELLQSLMYNTQKTGNVATLIKVFLRRSTELQVSEQCENKIFLWQTSNSLIILRYICKFLTQRMNESEFVKVFDKSRISTTSGSSSSEEDSSDDSDSKDCLPFSQTADELVFTIVEIICNLPVNDMTMGIHVEAIKCLIVMLSCHLYTEQGESASIVFSYFTNRSCGKNASLFTQTLLRNYLQHNSEYRVQKKKEPESIVLGLAASMWSMVQLATGLDDETEPELPVVTLGSLSILLLLNLSCHQPSKGLNPYKETLSMFQNSQEVSTLATPLETFKLDYSALYERLCATASQEPPMLLLYIVLHRNSGFRNFVLSRINLENLVLPVLKILHEGLGTTHGNSHHVYLALIVMLILSEDDFFCKIIHETSVKDIDWVELDRPLHELSLGALTALVFIRTIQKNALKLRDRYLHTNCLAALANMSASFKNLPNVVCQKLITLLETLTKRHAKMVEHMRMSSDLDVAEGQTHFHEDVTALEDGIRTLLEIVNSTLTASLRHNPNLIYTLLYYRTLFDSYQQHPMFQDLLVNISAVIAHFSSKVVHVASGDGAGMMEIIEKEAVVWPTDRLSKFPQLKFRYVEDDNTVEFFVPYVWRLCVQHAAVHFDAHRIKLFNALAL